MATINPDALANAMEAAMPQAWQDAKGVPLPPGDPSDRRPLFLAISRALLKVLHDNQDDFVTGVTLKPGAAPAVANTATALTLNLTGV
jgi:hypothetical protein